jgi:DNA-binding transcriptional LysR family regulator
MSAKSESFIRARLKARQLALLVHLDDQRSVLRAAEAVGMTQPAASKLLREFEEALEVRLFERHARGVAPTWFGEILVRHARSILSEITLAQEEIGALRRGLSGQASVGTVLSPGTSLVPLAIKLVKERRPALRITVELDNSKPLVKKLLQGDLDMVVGRVLEPQGADELQFEALADEQHAVIASADHPLAGKRGLTLADLAGESWIWPEPGSVVRDRLDARFLQQGLSLPTNVVQTTSLPVITNLLRSTNMVAALPEAAVQTFTEAGLLTVLIKDLGLEIGSFGIVTRRHHRLSPGAQVLVAALRETASKLYAAGGPRKTPPLHASTHG